MRTGEGVPMSLHFCGKCGEAKPCIQGVRQVGNEPAEIIYSCPKCLDRERDEYEARLAR